MTTNQTLKFFVRTALAITTSFAVVMPTLASAAEPHTQFVTVQQRVGGIALTYSGEFRYFEETVDRQVEVSIQKMAINNSNLQTTGALRLLVINLQLTNGAVTDRAKIASDYQVAAEGVANLSRGLTTLQIEMLPEDFVIQTEQTCSNVETETYVIIKELEKRMDVSHRFISFVMPGELNCPYGGRGQMPGNITWINGKYSGWWNGWGAKVVVHELGHNLGLDHQRFMRCTNNGQPVSVTNRVDRNTGCNFEEYGSPYSVMGGAQMSLTNTERRGLGWLRAGEEVSAANGTFTVSIDGPIGLLEFANADGDVFYAEMTQGQNSYYENSSGKYEKLNSGVVISIERTRWKTSNAVAVICAIVDGNPSTSTSGDASLGVGQVFTDSTNTLRVEVVSMTDRSATVNVQSPLVAPSDVKISPVVAGFNATWNAVTNGVVMHYELQYSTDKTFATGVTLVGVLETSATISEISPNTEIWVRIAAVDQRGVGRFSDTKQTFTLAPKDTGKSKGKGKGKGKGK